LPLAQWAISVTDAVTMTREEIHRRLDELAREYVETHNHEIVEELYRLARELEKMDKEVKN
jgi:FKBP-type peptidyl-prolyl cis-trans isomerase (trigger factor)